MKKVLNSATTWIEQVSFGKLEGKTNEGDIVKLLLDTFKKYGLPVPKVTVHADTRLNDKFYQEYNLT